MRAASRSRTMLGLLTFAAAGIPPGAAQEVHLASGSVLEPAGLKQGDALRPNKSRVRTGADGLVILSYTWDSEEAGLPCVQWIIIGAGRNHPVKERDTPGRCDVRINGNELDDDQGGVRVVTFHGTPTGADKGDFPESPEDARVRQLFRRVAEIRSKDKSTQGPGPGKGPDKPQGGSSGASLEFAGRFPKTFDDLIVGVAASYNQDDASRTVLVATRAGAVYELSYRVEPGTSPRDVSAPRLIWGVNGAAIVAVSGFYSDDDGFRHLVVATSDGAVREIFYHPAQGQGQSVIGTFPGIVDVAAFYNVDDRYRVVLVATAAGKVWEVYFQPSPPGGRPAQSRTLLKDFGPGGVVRIAGTHDRKTHDRRLVAVTPDGSVYQLLYHPSKKWREAVLYDRGDAARAAVIGGLLITATRDGRLLSIIPGHTPRQLTPALPKPGPSLGPIAIDYWDAGNLVYAAGNVLNRLTEARP